MVEHGTQIGFTLLEITISTISIDSDSSIGTDHSSRKLPSDVESY